MRATTSPPELDLRAGDYDLSAELGAEETGTFYLGEHVMLPRKAAIKILHAAPIADRAMAVAMLREACLVEALSHPGIPRVYECGILADKRPWTAFELVDGPSIATRLEEAPLLLADVINLVRDVADVLDHIHRRGIVHRAISTESIIPTPERRFPIFVRHWGAACTLDSAGAHADPRDDVRALGEVATKALGGTPAPLELAELIEQMTAADVARRPTSAELRERATFLASAGFTIRIHARTITPTR